MNIKKIQSGAVMNIIFVVSVTLATLLASPPAISASSASVPVLPTKIVNIGADSIESINAVFLRSVTKNKIVSLLLDGKPYQYRVVYSHLDGKDGEVTLELVNDPSKKATFGIRGSYVSAFIQTLKATYAMGYSGDTPIIGKSSTTWTTPSLSELPAASKIRIAEKNEKAPVLGASPMTLDTNLLASMKPGDEASFVLPGLGAVRVVSESSKPGPESSTWQGYLSDFGKTYTATITWNDQGMSGYIVSPQGDFTVSKTATTGTYVWNPTALGLKHSENAASCAADAPKDVRVMHEAARTSSGTIQQKAAVASSVQGQGATIDILIYYTGGMLTRYGSVAALTAAIDNYIALTNLAYTAGGLTYQMRRVGLKPINVSDTTDNGTLLSQLTSSSAPFSVVNSDRTATGADLVTIIRPLHVNSQKSCGVAWVGGSNNGLAQYSTYKSYMMSVLSDGVDLDTGKYYCDQLVLAHETGHNLGLMHDRATVATQGGGLGVTPYAFGYAVPQKWGSIMSYTFPHVVRFSNPDDTHCGTNGTEICGVSETSPTSANNIKALGFTLPIASGFNTAETIPPPQQSTSYKVTGSVKLNGIPDAGMSIVVSPPTAASCTKTQVDGSFTCSMPAATSALQLSVAQPTAPNGNPIIWTPKSTSIIPSADQSVTFSGTSQPAAKATLSFYFKYNNVPVKGKVNLSSGDASQVSCSIGNNVTTCSMTPNLSYTFSLGYTNSAKKAARCSPTKVIGVFAPGAKYTLGVSCI
jgi:hypothetical protein